MVLRSRETGVRDSGARPEPASAENAREDFSRNDTWRTLIFLSDFCAFSFADILYERTYFFAQPVARHPDDARLAARRADFSRRERPIETRRRRPLRFLASPSFSPARFSRFFSRGSTLTVERLCARRRARRENVAAWSPRRARPFRLGGPERFLRRRHENETRVIGQGGFSRMGSPLG